MNRRQVLALLTALPWGARLGAQTRASAELRFAVSLTHGLLLVPDGTLMSWMRLPGASREVEAPETMGLGHSKLVDPYRLYRVPGVTGVRAIAATPGLSLAALADGRVLAWGATGSGELGITPLAEFETRAQARLRTNVPTPVAVPFDAADLSCRSDHVLALARDGSVYAWGRGTAGQLGIGPLPTVAFKSRSASVENYVPYPVRIPNLAGAKAIAAGSAHSLALLDDGTVRAWGENRWGQVGDGTTINRNRPTPVSGVRNAVAIAATVGYSVAVLADGTAMEWGATTGNPKPRPVAAPVPGAHGLTSIVAGNDHFAALTRTAEVMTWGQDAHYEVGRRGNPLSAALVPGVTGVVSLAAAHSSTIAVTNSGRIVTWGEVRPWTRPGSGQADLSPGPILLWLDGLEQG